MTPAQVEQLTAEHDDIEDMIQALESTSQQVVSTMKGEVASVTPILQIWQKTCSFISCFDPPFYGGFVKNPLESTSSRKKTVTITIVMHERTRA
jgi:hypothetical protein